MVFRRGAFPQSSQLQCKTTPSRSRPCTVQIFALYTYVCENVPPSADNGQEALL